MVTHLLTERKIVNFLVFYFKSKHTTLIFSPSRNSTKGSNGQNRFPCFFISGILALSLSLSFFLDYFDGKNRKKFPNSLLTFQKHKISTAGFRVDCVLGILIFPLPHIFARHRIEPEKNWEFWKVIGGLAKAAKI